MAENKTKATNTRVKDFINTVEQDQKRADSFAILKMMEEASGEKAKMWGSSIIGFGTYHYKYDSGREGDFMRIGFSPRKQKIVLYLMTGATRDQELLQKLGNYKTGKSCLYINKLADVNTDVLKQLIQSSLTLMDKKYPR